MNSVHRTFTMTRIIQINHLIDRMCCYFSLSTRSREKNDKTSTPLNKLIDDLKHNNANKFSVLNKHSAKQDCNSSHNHQKIIENKSNEINGDKLVLSVIDEESKFLRSNPDKYPFLADIGENFLKMLRSYDLENPHIQRFLTILKTSPYSERFNKTGNIIKLLESHSQAHLTSNDDLISNLIEISCDWINQQFHAGFPGNTKQQCFSLAGVWSIDIMGIDRDWPLFGHYWSRVSHNKYLQTFLGYFMDPYSLTKKHLDNLTAQEFVYCVYLSRSNMRIGKFPNSVPEHKCNQDGSMRNLEFTIDKMLEETILRHLGDLRLAETGIVAHALHKSRFKIHRENSTLQNDLISSMVTASGHEIVTNQSAISSILKLVTTHDFMANREQVELVMQKFRPLMSSLNHHVLIR